MMSNVLASSLRTIKRRPGTAIAIAFTLAIGLAISLTSFSVLYSVVFESLPYPDGDRIVRILGHNPRLGLARSQLTAAQAVDGLPELDSFAVTGFSMYVPALTIVGEAGPEQLSTVGVSQDYFAVYGLPAELGRTFVDNDFTANVPVAVLGHGAWVELGGDLEIVGKQIRHLDGSLLVVGVLPEAFDAPGASTVYRPIPYLPGNDRLLRGVGRLRQGVSLQRATEEVNAHFGAMGSEQGASLAEEGWRFELVSLIELTVGSVRSVLVATFSISVLVVVVSSLTAMTLVALRLGRRLADLAIQRALGASRSRIAMESATELGILVGVAIATGWLLSMVALRLVVVPFASEILPRADNIAMNGLSLVFVCCIAAVAAIAIGMSPIRRVLTADPVVSLNAGATRQILHTKFGLVPSISIALTTASLIAAVSLTTSLIRESSVDLGFEVDNIGAIGLVRRQPPAEADQFLRTALTEIETEPGVREAVAILAASPVYPDLLFAPVSTQAGETTQVGFQAASAGYHGFMGIPIVEGRDIASTDIDGAPRVAVINETMARAFFGTRSPINEMIFLSGNPYRVVGVVADRKNVGARSPTAPEFVISLHQWGGPAATILIKYEIMPATWVDQSVAAIQRADPYQPISRTFTLEGDLERLSSRARFFADVTWFFSVLALAMGGFGTFAVVSAVQASRARETRLRIALGQRSTQAAARVMIAALRIVLLGLAIGLPVSVPVSRLFQGQLFLGGAGTVVSIGAVTCASLLVTGMIASVSPAIKALRADASLVLRES